MKQSDTEPVKTLNKEVKLKLEETKKCRPQTSIVRPGSLRLNHNILKRKQTATNACKEQEDKLTYSNDYHSFKLNKINKAIEFSSKIKEKDLCSVLKGKKLNKNKTPEGKISYFNTEIKCVVESIGSTPNDSFKQSNFKLHFCKDNLYRLVSDIINACKPYRYRKTKVILEFNLGEIKDQFLVQFLCENLVKNEYFKSGSEVIYIKTSFFTYYFMLPYCSYYILDNNDYNDDNKKSAIMNTTKGRFMLYDMKYFIPVFNHDTCEISSVNSNSNSIAECTLMNSLLKTPSSLRYINNNINNQNETIRNNSSNQGRSLYTIFSQINRSLSKSYSKIEGASFIQIHKTIDVYYNFNLKGVEYLEIVIDKVWREKDFLQDAILTNSNALSAYILEELKYLNDSLQEELPCVKGVAFHLCIKISPLIVKYKEKGHAEKLKAMKTFLNKLYMLIFNTLAKEDERRLDICLRVSIYYEPEKEKTDKLLSTGNQAKMHLNKSMFLFCQESKCSSNPRESIALVFLSIKKQVVSKVQNKQEGKDKLSKAYLRSLGLMHKNIITKVAQFFDYMKVSYCKDIYKAFSS